MAPEIMEEPYVLLTTPKPFGGEGSRSHAAAVHRHSSRSVKQRDEVAVAIDGEGVYIYDISTPKLVSSYAVSPQTRFTCKPCSIVRKKEYHQAERLTYVAVRQKDNDQVSIICFVEALGHASARQDEATTMHKDSHVFDGPGFGIRELIIVPRKARTDNGDTFDLVVIHDFQTIQAFSCDLRECRWKIDWPKSGGETPGSRFDFAGTLSTKEITTGLLANSHDALAAIADWGVVGTITEVLLVIRTDSSRESERLRWKVSLVNIPHGAGEQPATYDVCSLACSRRVGIEHDSMRPEFQIENMSGFVFAKAASTLLQWNIKKSQTKAQMTHQEELVSLLPLGYGELLTSTGDQCTVIDLEWQTVQGQISVARVSKTSTKAGSKRGRDAGISTFADSAFVAYFAKASLAVAVKSGSLFAIPLSPAGLHKRQRTKPRTLAETVGKTTTEAFRNERSLEDDFVNTVRQMVKENRVADLEEYLAKDINLSYERVLLEDDSFARKRIFNERDSSTGESADNDVVFWTFPGEESILMKRTNWEKANLVFTEIFSRSHDKKGTLEIQFFSPSIYEWLAIAGFFTRRVESDPRAGNHITASEIAVTLARADPTLSLLGTFLGWSHQLDLDAVVLALGFAIESLDTQPEEEVLQLTNGDDGATAASSEEGSLEYASRAAEDDLALALISLDEGMAIRGDALRSIFDRLSAFEDAPITKAFNKHLSPRKLVFLINLLRIELADGGWTSRYVNETIEDDDAYEDTTDQSIRVIIKLMNTAIDAIGPTGWNVNLSADKQLNSDEMLLVLRAEINAALEGSQEIQAIGAGLQEFIRYSAESQPIHALQKRREADAVHKTGFMRDQTQETLLPMGATVDKVEPTRTSKGGKVTAKSKGAIGQELSMRVGKYSLDRIRV